MMSRPDSDTGTRLGSRDNELQTSILVDYRVLDGISRGMPSSPLGSTHDHVTHACTVAASHKKKASRFIRTFEQSVPQWLFAPDRLEQKTLLGLQKGETVDHCSKREGQKKRVSVAPLTGNNLFLSFQTFISNSLTNTRCFAPTV
ncbi:hypothetical protein EYF80_013872 [Liparis tanakae]|uniref:Uncharacterized protein n=1 Tax=Liparis tanakae TaxID=230148 RepID=A0A4Z2IF09_9TELE|nr:hypothetical protein EYF80_013872 [Liparis tanakae]